MYDYEEVTAMSLKAIEKLNAAGIKCTVLTKGILPPQLAELSDENEYGISLVSTNEKFREKYEPNSAPYAERIAALNCLYKKGCKTSRHARIDCSPVEDQRDQAKQDSLPHGSALYDSVPYLHGASRSIVDLYQFY